MENTVPLVKTEPGYGGDEEVPLISAASVKIEVTDPQLTVDNSPHDGFENVWVEESNLPAIKREPRSPAGSADEEGGETLNVNFPQLPVEREANTGGKLDRAGFSGVALKSGPANMHRDVIKREARSPDGSGDEGGDRASRADVEMALPDTRQTGMDPDQKKAKRAEYMRIYRRRQCERHTDEKIRMIRLLEAQRKRDFRQMQRQRETEEQAKERRALEAQRKRDFRQTHQQPNTEDQADERFILKARRKRDFRKTRQQQETEEQANERRALKAQRKRDFRQTRQKQETEEQANMRRALEAQRKRYFRERQRQQETEEQAYERRALEARRVREFRQRQQQQVTDEQANERRALEAQRKRDVRKNPATTGD